MLITEIIHTSLLENEHLSPPFYQYSVWCCVVIVSSRYVDLLQLKAINMRVFDTMIVPRAGIRAYVMWAPYKF